MKKNLLFVLAFILVVSSAFANSFKVAEFNANNEKNTRYEQISWIDDFEGEDNWTSVDETNAPQAWESHEEGGTYGDVWYMGGDINGYVDNLYLVLDTPAINVTAGNSTLTFDLNYAFEGPGVSGDYDGWDGGNIRVSTDQENWTVLTGAPAYNCTSMYSFGEIHGEGAGVAGWGGSSNGWTEASFNLSAYEGQTVYVRFAFASDPAYNTTDDATLFGMKVDNISLGDFTNDGTEGQMVPSSMVPLGGDIWNLAEVTNAFSGTHVYQLQNDEGTYNPNMINGIISPVITLPADGDIIATFEAMGNWVDPEDEVQGTPLSDLEYVGFEVSLEGEDQWYAMSNPYGLDTGSNYVYSSMADVWMPFHEAYTGLDGRIDDYAGEDVRFKFYFKSDGDTPSGTGVMVDDFRIINDVFLANPTNLNADVIDNSEVELSWDAPLLMAPSEVVWTDASWASFINDAAPYAIKIVNDDNYDKPLADVSFMLYNTEGTIAGTASVYAWADNNGLPGTELAAVTGVADITSQAWTLVDFSAEGVVVPANGAIYVGVGDFENDSNQQGLLCDTTSETVMSFTFGQGVWSQIDAAYDTVKNVALKANILESDSSIPNADSYVVYHSEDGVDYSQLTETTALTYTHTSPVQGATNYYKVTAMFGANESTGTITTAFLLPAGLSEVSNDDGSSEGAYEAGVGALVATKYQHDYQATLKYIKLYVEEVGTGATLCRIHENDGGIPGTQLANVVIQPANLIEGWNTIELDNEFEFVTGSFFIVFVNVNNTSAIGFDEDTNGMTWSSTDGGANWADVTEGNLLVRAIVEDGGTDNDNNEVLPFVSSVSNYPNPFNPETTISFNMSKTGKANVSIYNIKGQLVKSLLNGTVSAGQKDLVWNGTDNNNNSVASGVYFYKVETSNQTINRKMVLQK